MFLTYALIFIIFPILCLSGVKFIPAKKQAKTEQLLDKSDTKVIRGIAAFFVMIAHYTIWSYDLGLVYNPLVMKICEQLGGLGVMIFFFVSGYSIFYSYSCKKPVYAFLVRRIIKVYLPYLMIRFLLFVIEIVLQGVPLDLKSRVFSIVTVQDWFVQVILFQYLFFFLAWKLYWHRKNGIIGVCFLLDILLSTTYIVIGYNARWYNAMWLFLLGMMFAQHEVDIKRLLSNKIWLKFFVCVIGFIVSGIIFALFKGHAWANFIKPVSGGILCTCFCIAFQRIKLTSRIMKWAGARSLHLYIIHLGVWDLIISKSVIKKYWSTLVISIVLTELSYQLTSRAERKVWKRFL